MNRGYIIPIGGAEDKVLGAVILRKFVELCGGKTARLAVIPTASQERETGLNYQELFRGMGVERVRVLSFEERADAEREDWYRKLEQADGVFLTGGNQLRLATTLGGTRVADLLRRRNREDSLHVAGTSAGAAILSEHMIAGGGEGSVPSRSLVTLSPGLGFTRLAIIDQHFQQRNRLGRLLTALAYNPRPVGIGLDEDTAAFIGPEDVLEVVGSGAVTVIDPSQIEFSSIDTTSDDEPISLIGSRLHVLTQGSTFDLRNRVARPKPKLSRSA